MKRLKTRGRPVSDGIVSDSRILSGISSANTDTVREGWVLVEPHFDDDVSGYYIFSKFSPCSKDTLHKI